MHFYIDHMLAIIVTENTTPYLNYVLCKQMIVSSVIVVTTAYVLLYKQVGKTVP